MHSSTRLARIPTRDITIFASLAAILYLSRFGLQWLPGIHPMGLIIASMTLTYRKRALIPLYSYIFLDGILSGFSMWWMPYLYIWLLLWGMFMLLGKIEMPLIVKAPVYMIACGLHGLSFGTLYAPAQALMFGLSFEGMIAWIIAGIPFDVTHGIGNFAFGSLIIPLHLLMKRLSNGQQM
ncbi:MAG: hypothetical protein FWD05_02820 [Oscillospiraceae bacterium]|nr:hypothetical protein [Oscillospiraceae bacterium]